MTKKKRVDIALKHQSLCLLFCPWQYTMKENIRERLMAKDLKQISWKIRIGFRKLSERRLREFGKKGAKRSKIIYRMYKINSHCLRILQVS